MTTHKTDGSQQVFEARGSDLKRVQLDPPQLDGGCTRVDVTA